MNRALTRFATAVVVSGGLGLAALGLAGRRYGPSRYLVPGRLQLHRDTELGQECLPRVLLGPQVRPERAHHAVH
jgi:hypothetical protein